MINENSTSNEVKDSIQIASANVSEEYMKQLAKRCKANFKVKPHDPPYTVYINGTGVMPMRDIWAVKAKAKNGKTQAATILMAGLLGSEKLGIRKAPGKLPKVLYIDTEQAVDNTIIVGHRVHSLLDRDVVANYPDFWAYNVRTENIPNKKALIEYLMHQYNPTTMVIDGVADLVVNFNDPGESQDCVLWLMGLAERYNSSIGCIIHENKGKEDDGMKGHLGTFILQKAADVFKVTHQNGIFSIEHETARNKPAGFIKWRIDDGGKLVRYDKAAEQISDEMRQEHLKLWQKVFIQAGGKNIGHNALKRAYMQECKVSDGTAKNHIKKATGTFIFKAENGLYEVGQG